MIDESDNVAYGDAAYASEAIDRMLEAKGCKNHIHGKGRRNAPLDIMEQMTNKIKSKIRVRIEHTFGQMTNTMHNGKKLRCIGMDRIRFTVGLLNLTYNLVRYEQLVRHHKVKQI